MAPPFVNSYKKGQVKTVKDCWTCRKSTFVCLMTDDYATTGDFFYTCGTHLKDRNFATPVIEDPSTAPKAEADISVSQAEIDAIVAQYKAKKATEAEKDKDGNKGKDNTQSKEVTVAAKVAQSAVSAPDPSKESPSEPTRFQLHKSFYEMRVRLHQQKSMLQDANARKTQLNLPSAPATRPVSPGKQA